MGTSQSVQETLVAKLSPLQRDLIRMNNISYVDVANFLEILNLIMQDIAANETTVVSFAILNPQVQSHVLWKLLLRLACYKTSKHTGQVESKRIMKLHQFVHLYDDINYQMATLDIPRFTNELFASSNDLTSSTSDLSIPASSTAIPADPSECPICWERPADVVLQCTHAYCNDCIKQWNRDCPLCRSRSNIDADSWQCIEMSDATNQEDDGQLAIHRNKVLLSLAEKAGQPMS